MIRFECKCRQLGWPDFYSPAQAALSFASQQGLSQWGENLRDDPGNSEGIEFFPKRSWSWVRCWAKEPCQYCCHGPGVKIEIFFKATSSSSVPSLVKLTVWESFKMSQEIKTMGVEHIQESRQRRSLHTKQYHTPCYSLMAELDTVQPLTCAAGSSSSPDVNSHYSCAVN